ncbi:TfuA-like protein [Rhizobium sp. Root1220]|uniref:TfuA-like protein n=1 Tax=Rhizobium sp. Root1220 TaxID=1736432 RepID=UPI0006F2E0C0|nr:TfuA-like protein [Rhizobium sp. Root1220]KQV81470.1 antibiotic resistance protein [Rhizobium sp. Root1220]
MKIIFVGPSLPDARSLVGGEITTLGPAIQGDVLAAVQQGADVIGIVDGGFEYVAPVRHKEILYALSQNVTVFGAASMGALRAAECQTYGMIGIGRIFGEYASGLTMDDADVALQHAPLEYGYAPLTVPLVNVRATLDRLEVEGRIKGQLRVLLEQAASRLFFKQRTWSMIVATCDGINSPQRQELLSTLTSNAVDQKRIDALELVDAMRSAGGVRDDRARLWRLNHTRLS